ncbi:MAG TPA: tetraacyldisaccharide 4'-kinase [Nitrospirota bacterium]|nr:tetraacyldisaccharide 4'-kinase [Nitrospirota bacterium]
MRAKSYLEDLMYGRKSSLFLGATLSVLSLLYRTGIGFRRALYKLGVLRTRDLPCTVISIGNITLGGTGKTPMVIAVARLFAESQRRPAVVSRGYGRRNESETLIISDGSTVLADAQSGGDEPVLIGTRLNGVPVIADRLRRRGAQVAVETFGCGIVILDDGFQHIQLKRDLDIVLVDAAEPFGNGRLFPAGVLREPVGALKRAHAVVITRAETHGSLEELKKRIASVSDARIFTSVHRPVDLVHCRDSGRKPLSVLRGERVCAFSGIARPASFLDLLKTLGAVIAADRSYPDHHAFSRSDLAEVYKMSADHRAGMIVTTEKDAVRLRELGPEGIWALRIELVVNEQKEWEQFLLNTL